MVLVSHLKNLQRIQHILTIAQDFYHWGKNFFLSAKLYWIRYSGWNSFITEDLLVGRWYKDAADEVPGVPLHGAVTPAVIEIMGLISLLDGYIFKVGVVNETKM